MARTTHRIWKYGDNVNTDVIFPGKYTYTISLDPDELASHALEDLDPAFAENARPGDVIVAGRNWGNGSSREQAVTCLVHAGLKAIIADSFARIYYRNAINSGLLAIPCPGLAALVKAGDTLELDMARAEIHWQGQRFAFPRLPDVVQELLNAGGIIPYLQRQA